MACGAPAASAAGGSSRRAGTRLPGRLQLRPGPLRPGVGAEPVEGFQGRPQLDPGGPATPRPSQPLPAGELGCAPARTCPVSRRGGQAPPRRWGVGRVIRHQRRSRSMSVDTSPINEDRLNAFLGQRSASSAPPSTPDSSSSATGSGSTRRWPARAPSPRPSSPGRGPLVGAPWSYSSIRISRAQPGWSVTGAQHRNRCVGNYGSVLLNGACLNGSSAGSATEGGLRNRMSLSPYGGKDTPGPRPMQEPFPLPPAGGTPPRSRSTAAASAEAPAGPARLRPGPTPGSPPRRGPSARRSPPGAIARWRS